MYNEIWVLVLRSLFFKISIPNARKVQEFVTNYIKHFKKMTVFHEISAVVKSEFEKKVEVKSKQWKKVHIWQFKVQHPCLCVLKAATSGGLGVNSSVGHYVFQRLLSR